MDRDNNDSKHNDRRSRSPPAMRRPIPLSPPDSTYSGFSGVRHGFNSGSNYGSFRGPNQAYRLPPITAMRTAYDPFRGSTARPVLTRTNECPALGVDMNMRSTPREDTDMTTPDPLQRPCRHDGGSSGRGSTPQPHICSCLRDQRMTQNVSPILLATAAINAARPYTRLPVNDVLNYFPLPGPQAHNGEASNAATTGDSSGDTNHPMMTPPSSSQNSGSISSASTRRPPFSVTEELCFLLNTLYHICMDATSSYISNIPLATRNCHNQLPRHRYHGSSRYHPYKSRRCGSSANNAADLHARRRTLMDNISDICTYIWRRARSNEMAPHRAEADAVHAMRELYKWGEIVVRGIEGDGIHPDREDGAVGNPNEIVGMRVALAAKNLCQWLGDDLAWDDCHGVMSDLRDLTETKAEAAGVRISEVDDESLDGNIT